MANAKTFGPDMRVGSGTWAPPRNVGVSARAYQDLKTILHRELITQIDLEKLTTLEDVRARSQVREVIQGPHRKAGYAPEYRRKGSPFAGGSA